MSNPESLIMLFAIVWTEKVQNWKKKSQINKNKVQVETNS